MTAKKSPSARLVAPASETALAAALAPVAAPTESDGAVLSAGLERTLARCRAGPDAPVLGKTSALAKLARSGPDAPVRPRALRKAHIGPRSGHK